MRLVYIDENGNEHPVSGRPTSAENLPIAPGSSTSTAQAIGAKTNVFKDKITIGSVTAGTKYDLFTLSNFTGGLVADFSALKGLMYLGGGGNANSYGYLFCNPITNIISYIPQVSDTNVSIYIAVLY